MVNGNEPRIKVPRNVTDKTGSNNWIQRLGKFTNTLGDINMMIYGQ